MGNVNISISTGHIDGGKTLSFDFHISNTSSPPVPPTDPSQIATHRVNTDFENGRTSRPKLPMVFVFDERRVVLTKEWQMYFVAINYNMLLNNVSRMWDDNVAFCNNTGFNGTHQCRNYILMEDMDNDLPKLDKTRTCGGALLHMENGNVLCLNGTHNPLLKEGAQHPIDSAEALTSFERYLYNPRDNPMYFFPATVTGTDFKAHAWPKAGYYPWYENGLSPVAWMFHVAPEGVITYPPQQWTDNTPIIEELNV